MLDRRGGACWLGGSVFLVASAPPAKQLYVVRESPLSLRSDAGAGRQASKDVERQCRLCSEGMGGSYARRIPQGMCTEGDYESRS